MEGWIMGDIRTSALGGVPSGTSENRPINPAIGQTYYNGTLGVQEIYTASGWLPATGANDFNVTLNGTVTTATFTKEYFEGAYTINSALADSTYDIYVYNTQGIQVGYTKSPSLTATGNFNKIVIVGGSAGDLLSFSYKTTFTATNTTAEVTAAAFITSVTPTALNSIDDTTTLVGGNFASNVSVYFVGSDNIERAAKSIVRSSSSQLIVTRPDNLPTNIGTYKVVVENPGITRPTGSSLHILNNAITSGTTPNWSTGTTLPEIAKNVSYTTTLVATDTEGTDIDYSVFSGNLPLGITLNNETGVLSGTYTGSDFNTTNLIIRAVDTGGNTVDRTFRIFSLNPVWVTGNSVGFQAGISASTQLQVTDDNVLTFSIISGSLPTGLSMSTSGLITGTPTVILSPYNITFRATDASGNFTDKTISVSSAGGATSSYAATSAQSLTDAGVTTNGLYWISLGNGQGAQQVFCILDPAIDGGGWMVFFSTTAGSTNSSFRYSYPRDDISSSPMNNRYSLNYAKRSGITAIGSQNRSLFYRQDGQGWVRLNQKVWDTTSLTSGNFRHEFNTSLVSSNGTTDSTVEFGATNYNVDGGGDMGIAINSDGLDHHNQSAYYNLNGGCNDMYLYNYGMGYKVNTVLSGWSQDTISCTSADENQFGFLVAMK
jgi:hypothetical protein